MNLHGNETIEQKARRVAKGISNQKELDRVVHQRSHPQHRQAMLNRLLPHLKGKGFVPRSTP